MYYSVLQYVAVWWFENVIRTSMNTRIIGSIITHTASSSLLRAHQSEWHEPDNESDTLQHTYHILQHTATHTKVSDKSPTMNLAHCNTRITYCNTLQHTPKWVTAQGLFPLCVAAFCSVLQCAMQRVDRVLTLAVIVHKSKDKSFVVYGVWWGKSLAIQLHILLYSSPQLTAHNKTPCWIQYHNKKLALMIAWGQQDTCPVSYYGVALVSRID